MFGRQSAFGNLKILPRKLLYPEHYDGDEFSEEPYYTATGGYAGYGNVQSHGMYRGGSAGFNGFDSEGGARRRVKRVRKSILRKRKTRKTKRKTGRRTKSASR
jgi:hypothetical protein